MKAVKICVKNDTNQNNSISKVFGSMRFFPPKSPKNYRNDIVLTSEIMKPPKDTKYVLVEYNTFIKLPGNTKGCNIMIYNQVLGSDREETKKDSMFKLLSFVINKLTST